MNKARGVLSKALGITVLIAGVLLGARLCLGEQTNSPNISKTDTVALVKK